MSCTRDRAHATLSKVKTRQSHIESCVHFLKGRVPPRGRSRSYERVNPRMILSDERSSSDTQCHPLEKCNHAPNAHLSETPIRGGKNHALPDAGISSSGHLSERQYGRHTPSSLDGRIQPQNWTGDRHRRHDTGAAPRSRTQPEAGRTQAHGLRPRPRPHPPPAFGRSPHCGLAVSRLRVGRGAPARGGAHVEEPGRRRGNPRPAAQSPEVGGMITRAPDRLWSPGADRRDHPGGRQGRQDLVHTPSAASLRSARSGSNRCSTTKAPAPITPARSPSPDVTTSRCPVDRGSAR